MSGNFQVVVCHATGNRNVRELLEALAGSGHLQDFYTTTGRVEAAAGPHWAGAWTQIVNKRAFPMIDRSQLRTFPTRELVRNLIGRVPLRRIRALTETAAPLGIQWVADGLDRRAARALTSGTDIAFGYLGQSRHMFATARVLGMTTVLEAHHATMKTTLAILNAEAERNPEWVSTLGLSALRRNSTAGERDIELADWIVTPSNQVTQSVLETRSDARVVHIPYGSPVVSESARPRSWGGVEPLRVLYVGRLQAIKGVADVSRVRDAFGPEIELTIVGHRPNVESAPLARLLGSSNYLGVVDRATVLELMKTHHVLILPSLVEGRSLAVLEALSVGLPAIVTPGTGTDDIVSEGGGIVVPLADPEALINAVQRILDDSSLVEAMSEKALASARSSSWARYRQEMLIALEMMSGNSTPGDRGAA